MPSARVPVPVKLAYGFGAFAEGTKNAAFTTFLLFYYSQLLGLPASLAGSAMFIALLFDALADPWVGALSDRTRTRLGRRHPYMYAAILPMGAGLLLIFHPPPGLGHGALFAWLLAWSLVVRVGMTLYAIPAAAMMPELTPDYDERTSLASWRAFFFSTSGVVTLLVAFRVFFPETPEFPQGQRNPAGYLGYGLMCGAISMLAIAICAFGTQHLVPRMPQAADGPFTLRALFGDLRDALRHRSYLMLVLATFFASAAGGFNDAIGIYVNTYFWGFTSAELQLLLLPLLPAVVLGTAIARPVTARFDKRSVAIWLSAVGCALAPLPVLLKLAGWLPDERRALIVTLVALHAFVIVTLLVVILIAIVAMIADVVDESEVTTGKRQEGIFASAITFCAKAASGFGAWVAGLALDAIQFPRGADVAVAAAKTLELGAAAAPGMLVLLLLTFFFLGRCRLTRESHRAALALLAERRAGAEAERRLA
jgi:Na+/melibiose symporter-like transporter